MRQSKIGPDLFGEQHFNLPDGRQIFYREYGHPDGRPVIALHGTPGSQLRYCIVHIHARRLKLRLIAINRWGYGRSSAPDDPRLECFAEDMLALANELTLERFAVLGLSGGGLYALGVAAVLGRRVDAVALIAPILPWGVALTSAIPLAHRFAFRVLPYLPGGTRIVFLGLRSMLCVAPALTIQLMGLLASRFDRDRLREPAVAQDLASVMMHGLRSGVMGPCIDLKLFGKSWTFRSLRMPVAIWVGEHDRQTSPPSRHPDQAIIGTNVEWITVPDAGHFWMSHGYPEVLRWLVHNASICAQGSVHDGSSVSEATSPSLGPA